MLGGMEMDRNARLELSDPRRIALRDAKLLAREETLARQQGARKWRCKCRICIGSVRSSRKWEQCVKHLSEIGRHPFHRGKTPVSISATPSQFRVCLGCLSYERSVNVRFRSIERLIGTWLVGRIGTS